MSRKQAIQEISDIGQANFYSQAENQLDYLITENWLPDLKMHGRVMQSKTMTTEKSKIWMSQQYRWNMMIEAEWEDMQQTNSPCDIFTRFLITFS